MKDVDKPSDYFEDEKWQSIPGEQPTRKVHYHDYKNLEHLIVCPIGDEHIGSKFYAEKKHKEILEWCEKYKTPIILMGDEMECATKTSVGAGVFEQDDILQQQLERVYATYKPLADKKLVLGIHNGNHSARVFNHAGADMDKILATMLNIPYLGVGAVHIFHVGKQNYTMYTTHGSSGARLPHTKIANTIKMQTMVNVETYCQGHLHQLSHHVQNFYDVDVRGRKIIEAQKHYVICGSFMSHWGSYAHTSGMEPARIGSPKIKLSGENHRIRVSLG